MSRQSMFGIHGMPQSAALHASWWNRVGSMALQGCLALAVGGIFCVILAYTSLASRSWSGPKDFVQGCYRLVSGTTKGDSRNDSEDAQRESADKFVHESEDTSTNSDKRDGPWSNELEARAAIESLLQVPFPKVRPPWLLNPTTNRRLELDLYSESLKLAVEVDGRQHAEWPNAFHATREMFEQQQLRDTLKDTLCKLQGVKLIRVPHTVKRSDIKSYLQKELLQVNITAAVVQNEKLVKEL